ncbi:hypothetical protein B6U90_06970 [Thermoplasmatales archaeon ex4484_6]|nr:MAG: hypothetical protein B6U90_06970 [Thermoplasmatales archaeon ex4484_6]RLF69588.1 MAG: hypothetical protein DRN57_00185 [Thermoplasmata archaeon]
MGLEASRWLHSGILMTDVRLLLKKLAGPTIQLEMPGAMRTTVDRGLYTRISKAGKNRMVQGMGSGSCPSGSFVSG